jgi:hypothetical protein
MNDKPPVQDPFELMARLRAADILHRVGSLRDETTMIEVRAPDSIWEIEFFADEPAVFERFTSDGRLLGAADLAALIVKWSDPPVPAAPVEPLPQGELALMRRLRAAGINFWVDELRIRRTMFEGAIMIEAALPGEHWEIDLLPDGGIEMERFESEFVHEFDAAALHELLTRSPSRLHRKRRGLRI